MLSPARSVIGGEDALRFRHVLIQQAAYRAVPKPLRASLHQEFADWLEGVDGASEYAEIAGYHLEQAHRLKLELGASREQEHELAGRAADLLALAGRRAFGRGDMPASVGLLERAALLPDDAVDAPRLRSDLGYALFEIGEIRGADEALAQAEERARESDDRATELSAMVKRGHLSLYTDTASVDLDELERQTERAIEELSGLGDDSGLSRAWAALSEVLYLRGRLLEAGSATEAAAKHARRAGSRREEAWTMGQYGFCLIEGPTPVPEAIARLERVLAEADENPVMAANLNGFLAVQEAMGGRIDDARARMAAGLSLTRDLGLRWQAGIHSLLGGYSSSSAAIRRPPSGRCSRRKKCSARSTTAGSSRPSRSTFHGRSINRGDSRTHGRWWRRSTCGRRPPISNGSSSDVGCGLSCLPGRA